MLAKPQVRELILNARRATLRQGNVVAAMRTLGAQPPERATTALLNAALEAAGAASDDSLFHAVYRCCDALVTPEVQLRG